jgi:hypothetical protein
MSSVVKKQLNMDNIETDKLHDNLRIKARLDVNAARIKAMARSMDNAQREKYAGEMMKQLLEVKEHYMSLYGDASEEYEFINNEFDKLLLE